jgi:glycosyltransferase involved in cell wall biosynthesis
MIEDILVSVIIPTYNVERFISSAVNSILEQSHKKLEIIVVDDGSIDKTYEILKKLQSTDSRLKIYRNETNLGIVSTLNYALTLAQGEYIVRMDGDDLCANDRIQRKLKYLFENPDIDIVGCDIYSIDENGNLLNQIVTAHNVDCCKRLMFYTSPILHIWMCRRTVYDILDGYRSLGGSEDYDFLLRADTQNIRMVNLPFYGYSVRIRNGNTQTTNGLRQRKIVHYIRVLYKQRQKYGRDSFDLNTCNKKLSFNIIESYIHNKAVYFTNLALKYRSEKSYIKFLFSALVSCLSPYQFIFFVDSIISKIILNIYNDKN